jgi:hypothetical protein
MAISELWVPEVIVCLFLVLPLFRPFVKALWPLDGLVWLPLIAVFITVGIFPAYGFRPECLPILLFAIIYNTATLGSIFSSIRSQPSDAFRDRSVVLTIFAFIMLGAAAFTMYAFSPRTDGYAETETEPARLLKIPGNGFGGEYCLQIYGPFQANRPIIFLVPPEIGASASVKLVCSELENRGYTVITYSRKDFDFPFFDENGNKHFSLLAKMPGYLYAYVRGTRLASANNRGKAMEAERQTDIEYLLPRIYGLPGETGNDELPPILLVGYGAGGSALAYLNDKGGFASSSNLLGIIAVESRLWSSYEIEVPVVYRNSSTGRFNFRILVEIIDSLMNLFPKTLKRTKILLPSANFPVLYLVSGRALNYPLLDYGRGKNPYQAIFDTVRLASGPIAIAAIKDAGSLDYQDLPLTHPVYSFALPWLKDTANSINDTASIIGNFASLLIERSAETEKAEPAEPEDDDFQQPETLIPLRNPINGSLYVESRGMRWLKLNG